MYLWASPFLILFPDLAMFISIALIFLCYNFLCNWSQFMFKRPGRSYT